MSHKPLFLRIPVLSNSRLILPEPTYSLPDRSKKSHARKQPEGHIPRPRNAFILFRCDFVRQKKIPESVESDHRNISRIVGKIWRELSDQEKEPWVRMAEEEKSNHFMTHRHLARETAANRRKRNAPNPEQLFYADPLAKPEIPDDFALERPASCPPGALRAPNEDLEVSNTYDVPMKVRDDLQRRPSRVKFYQSTPYDLPEGSGLDFFTEIIDQKYPVETLNSEQDKLGTEDEIKGFSEPNSSRREFGSYVEPEGEAAFSGPNTIMPLDWDSSAGIWNGWNQAPSIDGQGLEDYFRPCQISPTTLPHRLSFSTLPPLPKMTYRLGEGIDPLGDFLDATYLDASSTVAEMDQDLNIAGIDCTGGLSALAGTYGQTVAQELPYQSHQNIHAWETFLPTQFEHPPPIFDIHGVPHPVSINSNIAHGTFFSSTGLSDSSPLNPNINPLLENNLVQNVDEEVMQQSCD